MEFNKAYNRAEFLSFLKVNFLPEDFIQEESIVDNPVKFQYTQQVTRLGECDSLGLVVYEVRHSSKHDARVGLTKEAFRLLADEFCECALVFFVPEDDDSNYRFSLIEITLDQADNSAKVTRGYSNPHRYSYYLGKGISCHTPNKYLKKGRVQNVDDLRNRFSVEVLSDEFYEEYDKLYSSAPYQNCEPGFIEEFEANPEMLEPFLDKSQEDFEKQKKPMRDYVKKLMGRLVFMQFLQKKGWLGVPAECEGWKDGNEHFLQDVFKTSNHQETFLDDVLEPIFFEYLNTPYELRKRKYFSIGGREYKIPYLNGGLFEQTELDRKPSRFSVGLFQRLFDLFDLYNFTVDENDPDDVQVSVDPEMLGRIFENQLEDNNDKGAFYTPKFIVQYMCRESLVAYLQTNVEDDFEKECIRYFVEAHDKDILTPYQQKDILAKLKSVTICDPAIGSGAFPVGLLKELFYCRQELEPIASAADTKKQIIQENIYGVDIEQGAVDIARLRFWLSIVVDCERPEPLPNLDYKIVTGNSLLTTFNNKYVDLREKVVINDRYVTRSSGPAIRKSKKALLAEQRRFFNLSGDEKYRSAIAIKRHILDIIWFRLDYERHAREEAERKPENLFGYENRRSGVPVFTEERQNLLDRCESLQQTLDDESKSLRERAEIDLPFFDWEIIFSDIFDQPEEEKGFDIVIGNPPYIRQEKLERSYKQLLCSIYPYVGEGTADILVYFFGLGINLLRKNGVLTFITSNKFLKTKYGRGVRNTFANDVDVLSFIDFFELPVFHNASTDAGITLLLNREPISETKYYPVRTLEKIDLVELTSGPFLEVIKETSEWKFVRNEEKSILFKLNENSILLSEFVKGKMYYGIKTGCNEAFVIKNPLISQKLLNSESAPLIKKYAHSTDIGKWEIKNKGRYFLVGTFPAAKIDIEQYKTLKEYLLSFGIERLEQTGETHVVNGELIESRKRTTHKWFETQDPIAYYEEFSKPKLIYIHTAKDHQFYFDTEGHYINNSCYMIVTDSKFLFCFLNSKLFSYYKRLKFVAYGDGQESGRCKLDSNKMITVPIKKDVDEKPFEDMYKKIKLIKDSNPSTDVSFLESEIDKQIYCLYNLTYDEILIVDPETPITREEYENHK